MKVVHICNLALPQDHPDHRTVPYHPGRWVLNLALAQKAHTTIAPVLLVQVPGASRDFDANIEGVPVHFMKAPDRFRSATFFELDRRRLASRARALRPDLVHAHGTEDAYGLSAQSTGLPYVITAQGLFFNINRAVRPRLFSRERVLEFTEASCFRRADHVIAKSRYVRDALAARFPNLSLHEIPNTFDERFLDVQEPKRPNQIVFVGSVSPHKGVHTLREALVRVCRVVPGIALHIAGDSVNAPLPYEIEQKRLFHKTLGDAVSFHGQLRGIDLAHLVASSMALVAPSLEDMFGNQVVEALLLRTHGIVAEGTALPENVRRFGNGTIVPSEDAEALAKAIIRAVTQPTTGPEPQQARDAIVAAFGPASVAKAHREVYEQVLNG